MGAVVQVGVYLAVCFLEVFVHPRWNEVVRSQRATYMKTLLVLVAVAWAMWGYFGVSVLTDWVPSVGFVVADLAWVIMCMIPIVLAYFAIGRQEIFRMIPTIRRYEGSPLSDSDVDALQERLIEVMTSEKPYLEANLTVQDLAEKIGATPKDLSRVINERFGQNFGRKS